MVISSHTSLLYQLSHELELDLEPATRQMFHLLRIEGNRATHEGTWFRDVGASSNTVSL